MVGARWLGRVAKGGCVLFVVAVLGLHAAQPELSPLTDAVSYYAHGRHGALLTVGLAALGVGSLGLSALLSCARAGRAASGGVALWGACLACCWERSSPADPRGSWSGPPSGAGLVHATAAMVGFLALPCAAILRAVRSHRSCWPCWLNGTESPSCVHWISPCPRSPQLSRQRWDLRLT